MGMLFQDLIGKGSTVKVSGIPWSLPGELAPLLTGMGFAELPGLVFAGSDLDEAGDFFGSE